jgi:hypothetical protein
MGWRFNPFTANFDFVDTTTAQANVWERFSGTVTASTSSNVDTIALTNFNSVKYIISLYNSTNNEVKQLEIGVANHTTSVKDTLYGKVKGSLDIDINSNLVGSNFELEFINNETFDIDYTIAKVEF